MCTVSQAMPLIRDLGQPTAASAAADDPAETRLADLGGKAVSLARLTAAGLPVPAGFVVTTEAYRRFVAGSGLRAAILTAVGEVDPARPETLESAAEAIAALFTERELPEETAEAVRAGYRALAARHAGQDEPAVAVRSSATAEDLPELSFAGQQDSYLNIRGEQAVLDAVRRCWASLWTARAIGYRARTGMGPDGVALAVVVQELVDADAAGVLFTADPITGSRDRLVVNAAWGLGEAIVGGQVTPDTVVVDRAAGSIRERRIAEKATMTVRATPTTGPGPQSPAAPAGVAPGETVGTEGGVTNDTRDGLAGGTVQVAVPEERRGTPVLSDDELAELAGLGERIEQLFGRPVDIEWARAGGRFWIVQARPITTPPAPASPPLPVREDDEGGLFEVWNDSLAGDYLWTSTNVGEAVPDVMTPCTWSLVRVFLADSMPMASLAGHRLSGNIGGRLYVNLSLLDSMAKAFFLGAKARYGTEQAFGAIPPGVELPPLPLNRWRILREAFGTVLRGIRRIRADQRRFHQVVPTVPCRCAAPRAQVRATDDPTELAALWRREVEPLFRTASRMLGAGARSDRGALAFGRRELAERVSEPDVNLLLSGIRAEGGALDGMDSLGPVLGLARLAKEEIDRATYAEQWGHRGPHELEISVPRPGEDPNWIEAQLAGLAQAKIDPLQLLAEREAARAEAWKRIRRTDPKAAEALRRQLVGWARGARDRERARSEAVRVFWLLRTWVPRAGELTGDGEDLFFLAADEILTVLRAPRSKAAQRLRGRVAVRRATHARYAALPPYPTWIRGHFDPFAWAAEPHRRVDVFDAVAPGGAPTPTGEVIRGYPGAAGVVEGAVRVLANADQGDQLRPGEILVTTVTNVGWTPMFPRAAAVVTDVGAPLSHAAIVARELGIPAVIGCGDATVRLRTGDWVRVDGSAGTVLPLS